MDEQVKAAFNQVHFILDQIIFHRSAINYIDAKELGGYLSKLAVIINNDPQNQTHKVERFRRKDNHHCCCPTVLFFVEHITAETAEDAKRLANLGCDVQHEWEMVDT